MKKSKKGEELKSVSFELDPNSKVKLYFQLYKKLSEQISQGQIPEGTRLPSVRVISNQLNISRNTVTKAYEMLQNDGFITAREKSGFFAAGRKNPEEPLEQKKIEHVAANVEDNSIPTVENVIRQRMGAFSNFDTDELLELSKSMSHQEEESHEDESPASFSEILEEEFPKKETTPEETPEEFSVEEKTATVQEKLLASFTKILSQDYSWHDIQEEPFGQYELRLSLAQHASRTQNQAISPEQIFIGNDTQLFINHILSTLPLAHTPQKLERKGLLLMATQAAKNTSEPRKIQAAVFTKNESVIDEFRNNKKIEDLRTFDTMTDEALEILGSQDLLLLYVDETAEADSASASEKISDWLNRNTQGYFIQKDTQIDVSYLSDLSKVVYISTFKTLVHESLSGTFMFIPEHLVPSFSEKCSRCKMSLLDQLAISDFLTESKI